MRFPRRLFAPTPRFYFALGLIAFLSFMSLWALLRFGTQDRSQLHKGLSGVQSEVGKAKPGPRGAPGPPGPPGPIGEAPGVPGNAGRTVPTVIVVVRPTPAPTSATTTPRSSTTTSTATTTTTPCVIAVTGRCLP